MSDTPPSDDDYHHDPQLDRTLAVAIAQMYTATPPPRPKSAVAVKKICTHSTITRLRGATPGCEHCRKAHMFGWVYCCSACGYKACHNCRPRFFERTWDSLWGRLGEQ